MNAVEKLLGTPMAAPETPGMRHLRFAVIALAAFLGVAILSVASIHALVGPVVTGGTLALLLLATVVIGAFYFIRKARLDDAWLNQLIAEGRRS